MMREKDRARIRELLGKIECPHEFKCAASGFRYLCEAERVGVECEFRCTAEDPGDCVLANNVDGEHHCICPLRKYICENLGI